MRVPACAAAVAALAAAAPFLLAAADRAAGPLAEGRALLTAAADAFFDETDGPAGVRAMLDRSFAAFAAHAPAGESLYWQARALYVYGIVERGAGATAAAERRFTESLRLLEKATAGEAPADAWRLMADDYAQLMIVNGILYAAVTGWKVRTLAEKTLAADPSNPKARLTLALYAMNAPRFAGGSLGAALDGLHDLAAREDLEREDRFAVYLWLGLAERKKGRPGEAQDWIAKAREVYPGSSWARSLQEEG